MPELIVLSSFLRIRENFIGLGKLLELLFSLFVAGILIRMMLHCHLPESLLDLRICRIAMNAEHFVVITLVSQVAILWASG